MITKDTKIKDVKLLIPDCFEDHRGTYLEIYDSKKYENITKINFVQDDISISHKNVLRGLHGDYSTVKLVTVLNGSAYCLIADNREDSPTYKQWEAFTLSDKNHYQLLLPAGIGNSMLALTDNVIYFYKQNTHFSDGKQFTIKWNDPDWDFWYPIAEPILSMRDTYGKYIKK